MSVIAYHSPGVTYNGLHSTQYPTVQQVKDDLSLAKQHFGVIRTYYPQFGGGAVDVGKVAADVGLKVLLGLYLFKKNPDWTAGDYERFVKPAVSRGNVVGVLIGNEDPDMLPTITEYLNKSKADFPQIPVSTCQTSDFWRYDSHASQVLPLVDFIAVNIYPEWDWGKADANNQPIGVTPASGFESFCGTYNEIAAKYADKQVVVTETGWPTSYGKIPSQQFPIGITNASAYLKQVMNWAETSDPRVNMYVYGLFDAQHAVNESSWFNYHFGLIDYQGKAKGVLF